MILKIGYHEACLNVKLSADLLLHLSLIKFYSLTEITLRKRSLEKRVRKIGILMNSPNGI